jgi:recombination protein RecT
MSEENKAVALIGSVEKEFNEIVVATGNPITYKAESLFAIQALQKNDYLRTVAENNLPSLRNAVVNVSAIGITLNPALQFAYLVPRDKAVCLDISYKGLIKLATDTGSMMWVRADLVYEADKFIYKGPAELPIHEVDIFGDRGNFKGVYCIAKTLEGDILTEVMTAKQIYQVRSSSQAYKKKKAGPWVDWFSEMAKKTIIKRASKTWPRSEKSDRLATAIDVLNKHEGFAEDEIIDADVEYISEDKVQSIYDLIEYTAADIDKFLEYAGASCVEEIYESDFSRCHSALMTKKAKIDKENEKTPEDKEDDKLPEQQPLI